MPDSKESSHSRSFYYFQQFLAKSGPAASASYTLIGAVLLFALVGYFIDNHYKSSPWFTLGGTFLGLLVGFYELVKVIWSNK
jgi:F0F1-type ATP synthase assembly protein I